MVVLPSAISFGSASPGDLLADYIEMLRRRPPLIVVSCAPQ
jgi:hypothetical protein